MTTPPQRSALKVRLAHLDAYELRTRGDQGREVDRLPISITKVEARPLSYSGYGLVAYLQDHKGREKAVTVWTRRGRTGFTDAFLTALKRAGVDVDNLRKPAIGEVLDLPYPIHWSEGEFSD